MRPYEVIVDEARHRVNATLFGFWDIDTTRGYLNAMADAARRVARDGAPSWWLIDLSSCAVQAREVAELMGARLPGILPKGAMLAVVKTSSLSAMQSRRIVTDDTHRYFGSITDAEEWLTAQGRPL